VEKYLVLDRGYVGSHGSFSAHYQVKVRKESAISVEQRTTTIYNLTGTNPRVNVNSFDASVNVVTASLATIFEEIRKAITDNVRDASHQAEILSQVDKLEAAQDTPSFIDRYKDLVAVAADHLTLLTPFLPALTQMLHH
jgi:hypothetical protein